MGKIIRHLEYYGYADQNVYIGLPNCDLSDIHETNREQDKEIDAISGATKDKVDISVFNELSGKVDTFIDAENTINEAFVNAISSNTISIGNLEKRDMEITDKINEITDKFDPLYEVIDDISAQTADIQNKLDSHLSATSEFENTVLEQISGINETLNEKLDKTEADELYVKKDDVYTKDEIDDIVTNGVSGFATQQWVLDRHYISEDDADTKYAQKSRLTALEDRVNDVQTNLYNQYNSLNSSFIEYKTVTDGRISAITDNISTLNAKHDREIASLENADATMQQAINANTEAIKVINDISLPSKTDKTEFNDLKAVVDTFDDRIDGKLDISDFDDYKERTNLKFDEFDNKKADKTELNAVSSAVTETNSRIDDEAAQRIEGDKQLGERIDGVQDEITNIKEYELNLTSGLTAISSGLTQEILDRKNGDAALLGTTADTDSALTIYGTRKYANKVGSQVLSDAKQYTDEREYAINESVSNQISDLEVKLSSAATKAYVDAIKKDIMDETNSLVTNETERATARENAIEAKISQVDSNSYVRDMELSSALTQTSNVVAAITDWKGVNGEEYTDDGNGILDVLHRQFHDLKESIGNLGEGVITSNDHEVAFGTYNTTSTGEDNADKTVFSIGVGTSEEDRKNALEVRKNGDLYLWVEGSFICVNNLLAMLTNETY